jgi:hypothetical protein
MEQIDTLHPTRNLFPAEPLLVAHKEKRVIRLEAVDRIMR